MRYGDVQDFFIYLQRKFILSSWLRIVGKCWRFVILSNSRIWVNTHCNTLRQYSVTV